MHMWKESHHTSFSASIVLLLFSFVTHLMSGMLMGIGERGFHWIALSILTAHKRSMHCTCAFTAVDLSSDKRLGVSSQTRMHPPPQTLTPVSEENMTPRNSVLKYSGGFKSSNVLVTACKGSNNPILSFIFFPLLSHFTVTLTCFWQKLILIFHKCLVHQQGW